MIISLISFIHLEQIKADVFDVEYAQREFNKAIEQDQRLLYGRSGTDYQWSPKEESFRNGGLFEKKPLSPGLKQFDLKQTILDQDNKNDLSFLETRQFINDIQRSSLMTLQYSSPAQMDLYKFYVTNANLRLLLRYIQYLDLERHLDDPAIMLRKQAEMDCLRKQGNVHNIDQAFRNCVNYDGHTDLVLKTLNDPKDGNGYLNESSLIQDSLNRVRTTTEKWSEIEEILPRYRLTQDRVVYSPASTTFTLYFMETKAFILGKLTELLATYASHHELKNQDLKEVQSKVYPVTERILRQFLVLSKEEQVLALGVWAGVIAHERLMDKYLYVLRWVNRALNHPQIEPAIKRYIDLTRDEVNRDWEAFKMRMQTTDDAQHEAVLMIEHILNQREELKEQQRKQMDES